MPETARIVQVIHSPDRAQLLDTSLGHSKVITGEEEIKAYLCYLNTEARTREHSQKDETLLDLEIPIAAFEQCVQAETPGVGIRLLDTPGPNEAGEVALKAQVSTVSCLCIFHDPAAPVKHSDDFEMLDPPSKFASARSDLCPPFTLRT